MKRFFTLLVFSLALKSPVFSQIKKMSDLIGKWEIAGNDLPGSSLEIIDSTQIYLTYGGDKKQVKDYHIDFSKSPVWFDFTIADAADSTKPMEIKSILQVFGNGVMKWQIFLEEEDRSTYFTASRGEMMYLKKARPAVGPAVIAKAQDPK